MKKLSILLVVLIVTMLTSCGTLFVKGGSDYRAGLSAYESKAYVLAIDEFNGALAKNPEFEEVIPLYPRAFNEGVSHFTSMTTKYADPKTPEDAVSLFNAYSNLSSLFEKATVNAGRFNLEIKDVSQELSDAQLLAGQLWFDEGETLSAEGSRDAMIKAVSAYEKAKQYDPTISGLDEKTADAIKEATVRVMILGNGNLDGFHDEIVPQFQLTLGKDRFVEIVDKGDFSDADSIVGPFDRAVYHGMENDLDYLLEVYPSAEILEIDKVEEVTVPDDKPVFRGLKLSKGYQKNITYAYQLYDLHKNSFVWKDTVQVSEEPVVFEITSLPSEKWESMELPDDKKRRWDFLVTSSDNARFANKILFDAERDLEKLLRTANVTDLHSRDAWEKYFTDEHFTFSRFVKAESGKIYPFFVQAIILEAEEGEEDTFIMLGDNPEEAFENQSILSIINFALREVAAKHVESVIKYGYWDFEDVAAKVVPELEKLF